MRQWVKAELSRLRRLLESYKTRELSSADIRVILRGKALEFYSRHYGQVFTAENEPLSIRDALLGINQLLDEDAGGPEERPPSIVQPVAYQFLRVFGGKTALPRDEVGKSLRGTGITPKEFELRGWTKEENKIVSRVPIRERIAILRQRPRKEMKTEIDQAHFLLGAALPGSGVNLEEELNKDTWMVRRSVEAVGLVFAMDGPDKLFTFNEADELVYFGRSKERSEQVKLSLGIWNGAATGEGAFRLIVPSTQEVGGYYVKRVS